MEELEEIYGEYGPIEGYPTFENLTVMVITTVAKFSGRVNNIHEMIYLLPITRIKIKKPTRPVKKIKLPWPGRPGIIMTAKLGDINRGIYRSITKGKWDNSIMIDISNSFKNINAKLSKSNIHMTGAKNIEMGEETAHLLIDEINKISNHLDIIRDNIETAYIVSQQILDEGSEHIVYSNSKEIYIKFNVFNIDVHLDDDEIFSTIRGFFTSQLTDVRTYEEASRKLRWIMNRGEIISEPLTFLSIKREMVRYNFSLGFKVDQNALDEHFSEQGSEFMVDYLPDIRSYVKIELECISIRGEKDIKKHTFSIQPSGQTNYSCPIYDEMRYVYYRFINIINDIRPFIEIE